MQFGSKARTLQLRSRAKLEVERPEAAKNAPRRIRILARSNVILRIEILLDVVAGEQQHLGSSSIPRLPLLIRNLRPSMCGRNGMPLSRSETLPQFTHNPRLGEVKLLVVEWSCLQGNFFSRQLGEKYRGGVQVIWKPPRKRKDWHR